MKFNVNLDWLQLPIYHLARVFGIAPFDLKNNKLYPVGFWGKIYTIFLIALSIAATIVKDNYQLSRPQDLLTSIVYSAFIYFFGARTCVSLFTLRFNSDKIVDILNRINAIEAELKIFDNHKLQRRGWKNEILAKLLATSLLITVCRAAFGSSRVTVKDSVKLKYFLMVMDSAMTIECHATLMMFVQALRLIKRYFEFLNNQLQDMSLRTKYEVLPLNDIPHLPIFLPVGRQRQLFAEQFESMRKLHRELCELQESTTSVMAVPVLLAGALWFSHLLSSCSLLYTTTSVSKAFAAGMMTFWAQRMFRISITGSELFLIADASSSLCKLKNATNSVLIKVWNKFHPREMRDEFVMFTFQLLHNPVSVSIFGFLDLDYSFIYKILCGVLTYFIIMVQFNASNSRNQN